MLVAWYCQNRNQLRLLHHLRRLSGLHQFFSKVCLHYVQVQQKFMTVVLFSFLFYATDLLWCLLCTQEHISFVFIKIVVEKEHRSSADIYLKDRKLGCSGVLSSLKPE